MKEKSINNGLIAEFMNKRGKYDYRTQYHKRWDLLMAVVEKLEHGNNWDIEIKGENTLIYCHTREFSYDEFAETKIISVWRAVAAVIKWMRDECEKDALEV